MFAISSSVTEFLVLMGAGVVGAIILGIGKAVMGLVRTRQTKQREEEKDSDKLATFFFDQPRDPRTGTPATEGWTTKVDRTLTELKDSQLRIERAVHLTLQEVVPDGNGGHNMRGQIDKLAKDDKP